MINRRIPGRFTAFAHFPFDRSASPFILRKTPTSPSASHDPSDETGRAFTRWMAPLSRLLADGPCAHMQKVSSRNVGLRIVCRMSLLDTTRRFY